MVPVTRELARYAVESRFEDLPEEVRHEGERAFVNILGCMLGGAKADGIDRLLAALREFSGHPEGPANRGDVVSRQRVTCCFGFDEMTVNFAPAFRVLTFEQPRGSRPAPLAPAGATNVGNALRFKPAIGFF